MNVLWRGKYQMYLHYRQITWNNFLDDEKEANLSVNNSQKFSRVCMRFLLPQIQPSIFCRLFQCCIVNLILTKYFYLQYLSGLCRNADDLQPIYKFPKQKYLGIFQELNNVTLKEMPRTLIRQTLASCSLRVELLYTLFEIVVG